ncbi:MAG: F0F1 ATP synthase subunit A [Rubricoccaceae bacterium]|nr:F0F1 ATP synthase subunit A [Rubricoccaceae bacterium]
MRSLPVLLLAFSLLAAPALAQDYGEGAGDAHAADASHADDAHAEEELDALHHSADGFYLDFTPLGKVELPRIFLVRGADGGLGLDAFRSTKAAVASGRYVADLHHGEDEGVGIDIEGLGDDEGGVGTTELSQMGTAGVAEGDGLHEGDPLETGIVPVEGEIVADLSMTRHTVFLFIAALLTLLIFLPIGAKYRKGVGRETAPKGRAQNLFEVLVIYVREEIAKPTMGDQYAKHMPYLLTAFFFIFFANLLGLVPYSATVTSNIAVTAVLATFTFVITQFNGTKDYWGHIFNPPGVPTLVKPIMVPVEILGIFTKPFALAIRLFANMTAGHLVILSLIGLIFTFAQIFGPGAGWGTAPLSVGMALFVYLLELLIAFIQAYVFTILSALFIGMASAEHEHVHHDDHDDQTAHEKAVQASSPIVAGGDGRIYHEEQKEVGTEAAMAFSS